MKDTHTLKCKKAQTHKESLCILPDLILTHENVKMIMHLVGQTMPVIPKDGTELSSEAICQQEKQKCFSYNQSSMMSIFTIVVMEIFLVSLCVNVFCTSFCSLLRNFGLQKGEVAANETSHICEFHFVVPSVTEHPVVW